MSIADTGIARESLKLFGIAGVMRKVHTGLDSSYRVRASDGRVFALRVASDRPIRQVSAFRVEAEWIDALGKNRWFGVPQVHRTIDGELVGEVSDGNGVIRASMLLSWLPGRRSNRCSLIHARSLGRMAGALHRHSQTHVTPAKNAIKAWDAKLMCLMLDERINGLYSLAPEAIEPVQRVYLGLDQTLATLDAQDIGLINADIGLHNVLWHRGQAGIVDFNDSGIGPYAFCLARLVDRVRRYENGQGLVDELLGGYRDVAPLPSPYEKWGELFELAATVFRLNYHAARALQRGLPLRESEKHIIKTLSERLNRVGL